MPKDDWGRARRKQAGERERSRLDFEECEQQRALAMAQRQNANRTTISLDAWDNLDEVQDTIAFYGMTMTVYGLRTGEVAEWQYRNDKEEIIMRYWPATNNAKAHTRNAPKVRTRGWRDSMEMAIDLNFTPPKRMGNRYRNLCDFSLQSQNQCEYCGSKENLTAVLHPGVSMEDATMETICVTCPRCLKDHLSS